MRWVVLCALAVGACNGGVDVVARNSVEAGAYDPGAVNDPQTNPPIVPCGSPSTMLSVLTKSGDVHLFDDSLKEVAAVPVECAAGASALAVDRSGSLWIALGGKIFVAEPTTGACKTVPLALLPSTMAFVWDPKTERESLYAIVEAGVLVVVDTSTLATTFIGKLTPVLAEIRGLAGTVDGQLLAFAGDQVVTIAYVDTTIGNVKLLSQVKSADSSRFAGGVPARTGFELVFGANAWSFDPTMSNGVLHAPPLFTVDPGIVAVAGSPCAVLGK